MNKTRSKTKTVIVEKRGSNKIAAAALIISSVLLIFVVVIPILQNSGITTIFDEDTGQTITPGQGVKVTGVVVYANDTAVTGQTIRGMHNSVASYIATISEGAFTTNRGPKEGGTFDFYANIAGCTFFVATFEIPASEDYNQESVNIGSVVIYTASDTFAAMLIGSETNTLSVAGGTGSAGTTNYTMAQGVTSTFTLRIENTEDYSTLFRQYTDPRDGFALRPLLWIEIASTTFMCPSWTPATPGALKTQWTNSTAKMFLFELDAIVCPSTASVLTTWNFELNSPNTGTFAIRAFLVDGSYLSYVHDAESQVADPATSETVTTYELLNAYIIVS